jgi:hypothetical protein
MAANHLVEGYGYRRLNLSQETIIVSEEYYENRVGDLAAFVPVSNQSCLTIAAFLMLSNREVLEEDASQN